MSRLRRSRGRRASRVLVPVLVGGCAVFAGYLLWPEGAEPVAEAASPPAAPLITNTPNPVTAGRTLNSVLRPPVTTEVKPTGTPRPDGGKPGSTGAPAGSQSPAAPPSTRPAGPGVASGFMKQADALELQNKFLDARAVLNDALQSGTLDAATADAVKERIRKLNQTIIFTPSRRFADDPQQSSYTVQAGDNLVKICRTLDVPPGFIARVNAVKPDRIRLGQNLKLIQGPIHAVVSKSRFTMDLYLGDLPGKPGSTYLMTYKVGLGESGSTPTGLWEVTRNSKAANPSWVDPRSHTQYDAGDPKNPVGERWIGLTGIAGDAIGAISYGIHGTIEPETIGTNASMGCIRLKHEDVVEIYEMLSEGRSLVMVVD